MRRVYFRQQWYSPADEVLDNTIYDSPGRWGVVG
jgi:hypothetical protein